MKWRKQQAAIMTNNLSGAADITDATAQMLLCLFKEETALPVDKLLVLLQQISREMITAQSGIASLVNLYNEIFSALDSQLNTTQNIEYSKKAVINFVTENTNYREVTCRNAAALIPRVATVMTYSASSTVLKTLLSAQKTGKKTKVISSESRPLLEGRQLAQALINNEICTTLIVDAAIVANLADVDLVLLGSDSLTEAGIVSKIGTAGLAICAQKFGVPCYFLADSLKIWPAMLGEQPVHERSPGNVWASPPENLVVQNRFYDVTPWATVSGVITETGLQTFVNIRAQSHLMEVHPLLVNIITEVRSTI
ncbi:hypothetical protein ACFLYO_01770 [Chloroflexota bacterium]